MTIEIEKEIAEIVAAIDVLIAEAPRVWGENQDLSVALLRHLRELAEEEEDHG